MHRLHSLGLPITVAALAGVTFFALRGDGENGYWVHHPMLGALVSGLLLFAIGALVVERVIQRRNARRWSAAAIGANRDLGHVLDECLTAMWGAHSDPDPRTTPREEWDWTPAWRAKGPPPGRSELSVFSGATVLPATDYTGEALTPAARLTVLLADPEFVGFARNLIDHHRDILRDHAKEWAGLMMWAQHSQELLNALGLFSEKHMSRVGYHLHCNPERSENDRREAVEQWILADVKGRVLLNTLWGTNTPYRFVLPKDAEPVSLMRAFRYQDSIGRWRPDPHGRLPLREFVRREARWWWAWALGR